MVVVDGRYRQLVYIYSNGKVDVYSHHIDWKQISRGLGR